MFKILDLGEKGIQNIIKIQKKTLGYKRLKTTVRGTSMNLKHRKAQKTYFLMSRIYGNILKTKQKQSLIMQTIRKSELQSLKQQSFLPEVSAIPLILSIKKCIPLSRKKEALH